jgi:AcrR family transcriptional regulator
MARRSDHSREELHQLALKAAQAIVKKSGLRGLSTRRIAKKMGYTPGTLYQLFADLDDLILQLNAKTLDELNEKCREVDFSKRPEVVLKELADKYMEFVGSAPRLWSAVFEHSLPDKHNLPSSYGERVHNLLSLAEKALLPLFPADPQRRLHEAYVLWAGLYGITSLAGAEKLSDNEDPKTMVESLIRNYLAGLRANG